MNTSISVEEFLKSYGDVDVVFFEYYKYTFSFKGKLDDIEIFVSIGGDGDDVYRLSVQADTVYKISYLVNQADFHSAWGAVNGLDERVFTCYSAF